MKKKMVFRLLSLRVLFPLLAAISALITAGIYILNIVDANVDAHLMQFNVNDNLSLKPDLNQNDFDYKYNYGVTLTYNF